MQVYGFESAIEDYNTALRIDPNYIAAYQSRATAKLCNSQPDEALLDLDEAIRIKPDSASTFARRAQLKAFLCRFEEAKLDYQAALELATQQNDTALKTDIEEKLQQFDD